MEEKLGKVVRGEYLRGHLQLWQPLQSKALSRKQSLSLLAEPGMSGGPILNEQGKVIGIHRETYG